MTTEQERQAYRKLAELLGLDGDFANRFDGDRKPQPKPEPEEQHDDV